MKLRRMAAVAAATAVVAVGTAGAALAGTSFVGYNLDVPKMGGNKLSAQQTKAITDNDGALKSTSVGGGYTMNVCMSTTAGICLPFTSKDIVTGSEVKLPNAFVAGSKVCAKFTSSWTTIVTVKVKGEWKSN